MPRARHHGDAAGEPHQNQADRVARQIPQEDQRQREHHQRPHDPVLNQRERQHPAVTEHRTHRFVPHLGEGRVHHQDQPDRDRDARGPDLEAVEEGRHAWHRVAQRHPQTHGQKDPQGEIPVYE
jgi:hypothetical protein